jgi:hypothetical protein
MLYTEVSAWDILQGLFCRGYSAGDILQGRGKLGLIDRADKVAMIGAKVLVILEINGKYSIYNSQPDKL